MAELPWLLAPTPEHAQVPWIEAVWLERARLQGRLAPRDTETLASTILGALQGWAMTAP